MKRGTVVRGRYTIQALAGTGGMGSVYRATDPEGQLVALKVLTGGRQHMDMRFTREARILTQLEHPGIVRCLDSGVTQDGERFLVLEWLDGVDVETRLRAGPFALAEGLELAECVARALGFAHARGMVHRDVKPGNIFLPGGDASHAKLLDFGVAHWSDATSLTATGSQIGTPSYMAPEQIRGDDSVGPASDVFALGCVLFKCLTGQVAFAGANRVAVFYKILLHEKPRIADLMLDVPPAVADLLDRMLARDVAARPRDGTQVAEELARIRADLRDQGEHKLQHAPQFSEVLTTAERQLVSVVVVSGRRDPVANESSADEHASQGVTVFLESHSESDEALSALRHLRAHYESAGVSFDALPDGSLIAVLDTRRAATDQAADAARCALDLSTTLTGYPVAVATGRVASAQTYQRLDEVIGRAAGMLTPEHRERSHGSGAVSSHNIYLDTMTAGLLEGRFELTGKPGIQRLMRESQKTDLPMVLGKRTPFVGRKREMATLSALLDECVDESVARAILVTGPPGMGKTRLQREFLHVIEQHDEDIEVWHGRGDSMLTGSPLEVIAQAIRGSAGIREDEPLDVRRSKLRARVARSVPEHRVEQVCAFIGKLVKIPWALDSDVQLESARADARLMGDRVRQACEELLAADLRQHPVVLLIDDFQWASRATVGWIDRVLRNLAEQPFLVAVFARPEVHDLFPELWSAHDPDEIRLRALSRRAALELVRSVLGRDIDEERAVQLVERADGNALYLEGLVRGMQSGQHELPESMLAMVHSRFNDLPPPVRRVLRAASVFGKRFWFGGLAALLGSDASLEDYVQALLTGELIDKSGTSRFANQVEYRFRHDVIREAAYGMLTDEDRVTGHRLAAVWLERAGESDALVVAGHYERGGALEQALHFFSRAAEHECHSGDFEAAIAIAERGVACGATGEALGELRALQAEARCWDGQLQRAAADGKQAIELLEPGSRAWYDAISITSLIRFRLGQAYEVERYARTLSERPPAHHARSGWLMLTAELSGHLFLDGRVDMAEELLDRVETEIASLDETAPLLAARIHRARAAEAQITEGNPAAALAETSLAVACFLEAGDQRQACRETVNVGRAQLELGLFEDAAQTLRSALEMAVGLAVDFLIDLARLYLSVALSYQDTGDKALVLAQTCAENFEQRGNRRLAATAFIHLTRMHLAAGDLEAAEAAANKAMASCSHTSPVYAHALAIAARLLLSSDHAIEALNAAIEAQTLVREFGSVDEGEAQVRLVYAEALHATGQRRAARIAIREACKRLRERAEHIERDDWRQSFLHGVPVNRTTFELAERWNQERSGRD